MTRVLLWSSDPVGATMAGPGIRCHRLAVELSRRFDVTVAAPAGEGVRAAPYRFLPASALEPGVAGADVVVAQSLPLALVRAFRRRGARLVFDLYVPALVEASALLADEPDGEARYREVLATSRVALLLGDAFVCASERQRDHWLGALGALGRLAPDVYARDPSLRSLVEVVPFGLDPIARVPGAAAAKGVVPGIAAADRLLLWGGGIWNWFDPLTVIRAVGRLAERRPDVKLLFLGTRHPSGAVDPMSMTEKATQLARELGLEGRAVFFNRSWVAYEERGAWFAEADLGVSAHAGSFEARLAYRTRLLDHVAAGTPLVVTRGDVLAELVASRRLGRVVEPGDVDGWVEALGALLDDPGAYAAARRAVEEVRPELAWERVAEPLAGLVEAVAAAPQRDGPGDTALLRAALTLVRSSVARRGLRATVAAGGRAVSGVTRR